jgi:hypothetical protein
MCRSASADPDPPDTTYNRQETPSMTTPVAGIDPHQTQFSVGVVDSTGVELAHASFPNSAQGFIDVIDLLVTHSVDQVGIEGSVSWGAHVAIALTAAGFDTREVPAQRCGGAAPFPPTGKNRCR